MLTALSLAGIGTSAYLTYSHYADQATVCAGIGSCEFVQTSSYSKVAGVPVSLMGLLFFVALILLSVMQVARRGYEDEWARPVAFSMTLGGTAFVGYLTFVELFVIDAICIWCVATAIITALCFLVAIAAGVFSRAAEEFGPDG